MPIAAYSQKAFEAIYYIGKTQNITAKFMYADGYIGACEIKTIDEKTKKSARFLPENGHPDNNNKMKFYHYTTSGKTFQDYFILDGIEDEFDSIPTKLYGRYYYKGVAFSITLTKM